MLDWRVRFYLYILDQDILDGIDQCVAKERDETIEALSIN